MRLFILTTILIVISGVVWGQDCDASFTTNVSGCNDVTFTPSAEDTSFDYIWDFGDGNTSNERVPTHRYFSFGNATMSFTATLTVNGDDCDERSTTQNVTVQQVPNVNITDASGASFVACSSGELSITNSSSTVSSNNEYEIDWGDASPVETVTTFNSLSHPYFIPGNYVILVKITGENGCVNTETFSFINSVTPNIGAGNNSNSPVCLPGTAPISITNTSNNTNNTIYIIRSNSSSDSFIINHPPPSIFDFPFDSSACGTISTQNGIDFLNAFQITITASTGCPNQDASAAVTPVRTTTVPDANFTISPDEDICEFEPVIVTNTSIPGEFWDSNTNECRVDIGGRWTITPSSGFNITSGDLTTPEGFTASFTEDGTYTIRLIVENNVTGNPSVLDPFCPADTMTRVICIIPIPDSEFTPEEASGCTNSENPLIVDFDNESNILDSCDPDAQYTWSVGFNPGGCGTSPSWTQLDRTPLNLLDNPDLNDQDIRLRFDSAGIYTVYLRVANECGVNTDSTIITVSGAPKIDITPISDSCLVETFVVTPTLSFDADCNSTPTYEWSFPDGTPNEHTGEFPPAITYDEPGSYVISLTVENECGETVIQERFELFDPPTIPNIQVTEEVCVGGIIAATDPFPPAPASNDYSWAGPNGFSRSSATWEINPATAAAAGTYTLTVTDANGCTNTMDYVVDVTLSAPIRINPDPAIVCIGEDITLTAFGGVTYSWEGDHLDGDSGGSVVFSHDVVGEFEVIVVGADPAGACDGSDTIMVSVVALPMVEAGALRLGCVGNDFDFQAEASPAITGGATGSWSGDHISPAGIFNVDIPGEYTVTYNFTDTDGCSGSDEAMICIRELPEAGFTLAENFACLTDDPVLRPANTSNTLDDCSAATYLWTVTYNGGECGSGSGASEFIDGTDASSADPAIRFTESGEYTLSLTVSNDCATDVTTEIITIGDVPSIAINDITDKCGAQPVNFTAVIIGCNSDITTYAWEFPTADPPAVSDAASPSPIPFSVGVHTASLTVTNACGTTTRASEFEVLEGPIIDITVPEDSVCVGDQLSVMGNSSGSSLSFSWTASNPGITFSDSTIETPTISFAGAPVGPHSVTVRVRNAVCDPVMTTFNVYVNDLPNLSLDDIADGCGNVSFMPGYDTGIPVGNIDAFLWELSDGMTNEVISTSATPGLVSVDMPGSYTLTLTANNSCGTDSDSQTFRIFEGPDPRFDVDNTLLCRDGVNTVSLTDASGGDIEMYNWTVVAPNGSSFATSTEPSPTFTFGGTALPGEYTIRVLLSNSQCMPATPWDTTIMLNAVPMITIGPIEDGCGQASIMPQVNYGLADNLIDSVRWRLVRNTGADAGAVIYSGAALTTPIDVSGPGTYTFTATAFNRCAPAGVEADVDFRLYESPTGNYSTDTDFVCRGTGSVALTSNFNGDIDTYEWTVTEVVTGQVITGLSSVEENPVFAFGAGLRLGDYTIAVSLGNAECVGVPWDTIVRLNAEPASITLAAIADDCDRTTFDPAPNYGEFTAAFVDSVRWTFPPGSVPATSTERDPGPVMLGTTGQGLEVRLEIFNGCGMTPVTTTFDLLVGPVLNVTADTSFVCRGDAVNIINNSVGDNLSYAWTANPATGVTFSDAAGEAPMITFDGPVGDYTISAAIGNMVCGILSWDTLIRVSAPPTVTIVDIQDICGPSQVTFTGIFSDEAFIDSVRWRVESGDGTLLFTSDSLAPAAAPLNEGSYTVIATAYNKCGSNEDRTEFRVLAPIVVEAALDTHFSCSLPFVVAVTNATAGDDLNYDWSVEGPFAGNVEFDAGARDPVFTIRDTGVYVISQRVFNETCGEQFWRDTVTVLAAPIPVLVDQLQFCEAVNLTPEVDYGMYRIDSVLWEFPGSGLIPPVSREFNPTGVPYSGAGTYTYSITAYNACGGMRITDSFTVDTIPMISLGPTDTICITDGLFTVAAATVAGGTWRDSLGRTGVITEQGVFDPVVATGGITVIEYVYAIGACEVITSKDIFVVDLSELTVEPAELNPCVTETAFVLDNGSIRPGWYTGPGVTDSLGVFDAASLGVGDYTLTYHYRAPGTDCIETRNFRVSVRPPPLPEIQVTDSICVNVPTDVFDGGSGSSAWGWTFEDGSMYTTESLEHTFPDTGLQTILLVVTSEFGCSDSTSREVYVSGPPIAQFTKDTSMGCALLPVNFENESIGFEFVRYGWDFGNGENSSAFNPTTVLYDQGNGDTTYYINLLAVNACGEDSYQDSVIVFPNPKAFLDVSQDEGCTPLYVEFLNITRGLPDRFEWYIDGELYSRDSIAPDRSFIAPDSMNVYYEVMLIAFNECGSDTSRRTITVLPDNVRAFFSVEDQIGCEPFDVQFRNFSDPDSLVTFDWFFGDGSTSQLKNPLHTFRNTSDTTVVYEVTLVADNGCGQDSIMIPITVHPAPQVSFTAPPITCARDTVFFTNTSEDVTNPIWVFGDGDTLTMIESPGHVFDQPGDYTVELTAFAVGTGCPNTWTETINIRPLPVADATAGPLFGCPPLDVNVSNLSSNADFYSWDFGDGNTDVGATPSAHRYTEPGLYDITLTARDEFGCAHDSVVATVQVYPVPVVSFETEPDRQCGVPTEFCFENNSENGGGYRWDFGNGQSSTDNNPCVTYDTPGDYVISLVVTNEFTCETRTEVPITVYGIPVAGFSIPDSMLCEVATVTFTNTSQEAEFAEWTFSDGFVSNEFNVTRTFTEIGRYGFTLIVSNGSGCSDTLVTGDFLEVNPSPIADFNFFDLPDELPTTIEFTDLSSSDAIVFGWDFDDGFVSDEMNPVHRYLSSFDKTVLHWVENEFGCTDTITMVVDLDTLGALYIPNIFTPGDASTLEKDIFKPKGIGLGDYYIAVYARNGQIVWESDAVDEEGIPEEAWDGTFQGQPMPAGTYVWRVHRASYFNGRPWRGMEDDRGRLRQTGYVTLVR